jgi:hypothetical protein
MDYSKIWVSWVEPFSEVTGSDPMYSQIKATTAIKLMRTMHPYPNDDDALMDFVSVYWANLTEEK